MPEAAHPRRSARGSGTSRSRRARCRRPAASEQGTVYVLDEPKAIEKKFKRAVTDSGTEIVRRRGQARRLEPDRDPRRGPRRDAGGDRGRHRGPAATATSRSRSARRWSTSWRRCASATPSCGPTRPSSSGILAAGAERPARSPRRRSPTCASGWASDPLPSAARLASRGCRTAVHRLELDLDVFAGPVRPAAVADPARGARPARGRARRGRARLPRPPRGARRARPRGDDRVPGPDRRAAGAQVAADAAGRGDRGARRAGARRGGRGAARADARATRASAARRAGCGERSGSARRVLYRSAPLPDELRAAVGRARRGLLRPGRCSAPRSAACCARRRRSTSATWRCPRVTLAERLAHPARAAAARRLRLRRGRPRTPTA